MSARRCPLSLPTIKVNKTTCILRWALHHLRCVSLLACRSLQIPPIFRLYFQDLLLGELLPALLVRADRRMTNWVGLLVSSSRPCHHIRPLAECIKSTFRKPRICRLFLSFIENLLQLLEYLVLCYVRIVLRGCTWFHYSFVVLQGGVMMWALSFTRSSLHILVLRAGFIVRWLLSSLANRCCWAIFLLPTTAWVISMMGRTLSWQELLCCFYRRSIKFLSQTRWGVARLPLGHLLVRIS